MEEQQKYVLPARTDANVITPDRIQLLMDSLTYRFERVGDTTMTGCWAFLPNGFQVGYGQSACVDPARFNQADGDKYALERCQADARSRLWEFEGYRLAMQLNPV
jgi:hypothetical protein